MYSECVKPDVDIEMFVSTKRSGYHRPGPTLYKNYYTGLNDNAIFGVALVTHLTKTNRPVPMVIEKCATLIEAKGINQEGIYRVSGSAQRVRTLRTQIDKDWNSANLEAPNIIVRLCLSSF